MFNLTSSVPKSWQTVSRQADRATNETTSVPNTPVPNTTVHNTTVHHQAHLPPPRDLGGVLRERREAMGASLAEVEMATRIRQKYLAALESNEWHLLPGEVVGRGFLRNYATYLGLDPTEVVERRRTVADPQLSAALYGTSAGSALPPERAVDYRPKDVLLKDEQEGIQQRELRVGPFFAVVTVIGALLLIWWLASNFGGEISTGASNLLSAAQTRGSEMRSNSAVTPTPNLVVIDTNPSAPVAAVNERTTDTENQGAPVVNPPSGDNLNVQTAPNPPVQKLPEQPGAAVVSEKTRVTILIPTNTPATTPDAALNAVPAAAFESAPAAGLAAESVTLQEPDVIDEPEPEPTPTNTLEPTLTPTNTPEPTPEEVDTPAPPPVVAASCSDSSMAFFTPGVGQVLSGAVSITGRAVNGNIDYYKLEYAVGANADGGYVWFDGNRGQVEGGILGNLNTNALPNGDYTLQLTVVDLTGNYPPPCRVAVVIQN